MCARAPTLTAACHRHGLGFVRLAQVAHAFADLHDTPGRMLAKGCLNRVVPWHAARRELFLRLRRRLVEASFCRRVCQVVPDVSSAQVRELYAAAVVSAPATSSRTIVAGS